MYASCLLQSNLGVLRHACWSRQWLDICLHYNTARSTIAAQPANFHNMFCSNMATIVFHSFMYVFMNLCNTICAAPFPVWAEFFDQYNNFQFVLLKKCSSWIHTFSVRMKASPTSQSIILSELWVRKLVSYRYIAGRNYIA